MTTASRPPPARRGHGRFEEPERGGTVPRVGPAHVPVRRGAADLGEINPGLSPLAFPPWLGLELEAERVRLPGDDAGISEKDNGSRR